MAKNIFPVGNSGTFVATPEYDGNFVELGTGAANAQASFVTIEFSPDMDFVGTFIVMGRWHRSPAQGDGAAPFLPISYIAVNVDGTAVTRPYSTATITGPGMIEVPSNGINVAVLMACSAGSCTLYLSRLAGTAQPV